MSHYKHLTIEEREKLYLMRGQGKSLREIARETGRSASTLSRELSRNKVSHRPYSPSAAQRRYMRQKQNGTDIRQGRILNSVSISERPDEANDRFADPYSPWQRGTNENTNGLLRECVPKSADISAVPDAVIQQFVDSLNRRPRKFLGWLSPYEIFFDSPLHLT